MFMSTFKDLLQDIKTRLQSFSEPSPKSDADVRMEAVKADKLEVGGIVTDANGNPYVGVCEIDGMEITTTDGGVITELKPIADSSQPDSISEMQEKYNAMSAQVEAMSAQVSALEQKITESQNSFNNHVTTSQELFTKFSDALEALNTTPVVKPAVMVAHKSANANKKLAATQAINQK
jgi:hypothetical protein